MIGRFVLAATGIALFLASTGCHGEAARRKERDLQRAASLAQGLAEVRADFTTKREELRRAETDLQTALASLHLAESGSYRDELTACDAHFTASMEKVVAGRVPEIVAPALAGWRASAELHARAFGLAHQGGLQMDTLLASSPRESNSPAFDRFQSRFNELKRRADIHLGVAQVAMTEMQAFAALVRLVAVNGAGAERAAAFDQLAGEVRTWPQETAGAVSVLLRSAWATEDDPARRAHKAQKLTELGLPLAPPPVADAK